MSDGAPHTPALAAGVGGGPRRSLLLSGGGMRVAYQAGALVALERAGLTFAHGDGTSGGTMNLAMLLSGVAPADMCERWRTLDPHRFVSVWPPRRLLRGPPYPALGSSDSLRRSVYPHLGIDVARIRAAQGIEGTFNVGDFGAKLCVSVPHREVDVDLLVAGMSLPILSPAVRRGAAAYVDAAWIKDTNVAEAVRRGAEEVWLVWAIGNHGVYRDGVFQQYVHMMEMSANGSLFAELAMVRQDNEGRARPVRVHVIRPRRPLPLDPDLFFGRVDAATLVAMGHADACAYLASRGEEGVPLGPEATRMIDPVPGVGFRETLAGVAGGPLRVRLAWEIEDLEAFAADGRGRLVGDVTAAAVGERVLATGGSFQRHRGRWRAELELPAGRLELTRRQRGWPRVHARLLDGAGGELGAGVLRAEGTPAWATMHARGVGSAPEGARALARFAEILVTPRARRR